MTLRMHALPLCLFLASPLVYATNIDLMSAGNSGSAVANQGGTFLVQQISPQSTGTGVIDSFLRIQQTGQERGYNTDVTPPPLDDKAGNFTHSLLLSDVPIVTINGVQYRQFLLDINQNGNELLSLNQIQIFQSNGDATYTSLTEAAPSTDAEILFGAGVNQVFEMNATNLAIDSAARTEIELNYALNAGSGSGDMFLYVPDSDFSTAYSNVILFSQFGSPRGTYESNDGFEEWAVLQGSTTTSSVPEPASIILLGTFLCGLGLRFKRRAA